MTGQVLRYDPDAAPCWHRSTPTAPSGTKSSASHSAMRCRSSTTSTSLVSPSAMRRMVTLPPSGSPRANGLCYSFRASANTPSCRSISPRISARCSSPARRPTSRCVVSIDWILESHNVEKVYSHPEADIDAVVTDLADKTVVGVRVYSDKRRIPMDRPGQRDGEALRDHAARVPRPGRAHHECDEGPAPRDRLRVVGRESR